MKILYTFGGIPPYFDAQLNKLVQKGVDTVVVIPKGKSPVLGKGVKVIDSRNSTYQTIQTDEELSVFRKPYFPHLPDIIRTEKPDILVTVWPYFLQFFFQPALRKVLKSTHTRFVIREIPFRVPPYGKVFSYFKKHRFFDEDMKLLNKGAGFILRQWITMQIRRYCYKRADGALAYASLGKELMPTYGIAPEKVFVTYNSNNTDAMFSMKRELSQKNNILKKSDYRIVHVGRLVKWKRVDLLIDAFSKIAPSFPRAELVVIGGGPEMENLKEQAVGLHLGEKVVFTGAIHDNETIAFYLSASAIYVLAGMGGLSINDAMTFGLPVICSVCDGTEHDLVVPNKNGFFFEENDVDGLADKLLILLKDPSLASRMGEESWKIIRDKVNLDTVSDRYINAYKNILA
ncbi:glycosyltransferase family 4 protein [Proteiniphilum sp.]|uniref:glycosyltransferase family 4 protein n=1 Tax=Proteiniphilum sp. TaxID=1926877 RepID=UPI00332A6492